MEEAGQIINDEADGDGLLLLSALELLDIIDDLPELTRRSQAFYDELVSSGIDTERASAHTTWMFNVGMQLIRGVSELVQCKENEPEETRIMIGGQDIDIMERLDLPPHSDSLTPYWRRFADALSSASGVPTDIDLIFSHVQMTATVTDTLLRSLKTSPLRALLFQNNRLGSDGIESVVTILQATLHLKLIVIENNPIESKHDARSLIRAMSCHPNLQAVNIARCQIGHNQDVVAEVLPILECGVSVVNLHRNFLGPNAAALISSSLASNPSVRVFNLEDNFLNDAAATLLAGALRTNATLRKLQLKGNPIQKKGINALYKAAFNLCSMNDIIHSNHTCFVDVDGDELHFNADLYPELNKKAKIQDILYRCYQIGLPESKIVFDINYLPIKLMPRLLAFVQDEGPAEAWKAIFNDVEHSDYEFNATSLYLFMREWSMPLLYTNSTGPETQRSQRTRMKETVQPWNRGGEARVSYLRHTQSSYRKVQKKYVKSSSANARSSWISGRF